MKDKTNDKAGWRLENSYAGLSGKFYTLQRPEPVPNPELVIFNQSLAEDLGLNVTYLKEEGAEIFSGNKIPAGSIPLAEAYAGHQFGHFTMLGDGRAVLLGEQIIPDGRRIDIQLKGSGRTPYSRGGDGKAALGPMLREYIISEAMHGLGIPTTRSLGVVTTGETIYREKPLPGAVLTRTASSHIRVGTFQYASRWGTLEELKTLADYTLKRHYPEAEFGSNKYLTLLEMVVKAQAELIAKWQLVGFIHGVMNTDNMAISGETIDYGPCAFMDAYNPETVFSSIDTRGRYAYCNQPAIAVWDLSRFAEALLPLIDANREKSVELAGNAVSGFEKKFKHYWLKGMRSKLGIFNEEDNDEALALELLGIMQRVGADYTNTFRALTFDYKPDEGIFRSEDFKQWENNWQKRVKRQQEDSEKSRKLMENTNPAVIPRNHRVEEALAAADKGDYSKVKALVDILSNTYTDPGDKSMYYTQPNLSQKPYITYCGT